MVGNFVMIDVVTTSWTISFWGDFLIIFYKNNLIFSSINIIINNYHKYDARKFLEMLPKISYLKTPTLQDCDFPCEIKIKRPFL